VATCRGVSRSTEVRLATHYLKIQFITQLSTKTRVPLVHNWTLFNLRAKQNPTRMPRFGEPPRLKVRALSPNGISHGFFIILCNSELHRLQRRSTYVLLFVIVFESDVMTI
jgi:hypothetical protein